MKKSDVISHILGKRYLASPKNKLGQAFAPTNIALVKYWGKRNTELNLPITSSLSISLADKGAHTQLIPHADSEDKITVNNKLVDPSSAFAKRLVDFLNLFRKNRKNDYFDIHIQTNIPIAAGLASSACGFAALVQALNQLYDWNLTATELSILARLGSGSASRSIWQGFVEWQQGEREDGMDSHGVLLNASWPELCIGLLIMQDTEKTISSREAMLRTVATSALYSEWPVKVATDLAVVKQAIQAKDFNTLGKTAESNAMTMHALMLSAWPPVSYATATTIHAMQKIWQLRSQGLDLYFTQDAGPNLKLLFLAKDSEIVRTQFPEIEMIKPFSKE